MMLACLGIFFSRWQSVVNKISYYAIPNKVRIIPNKVKIETMLDTKWHNIMLGFIYDSMPNVFCTPAHVKYVRSPKQKKETFVVYACNNCLSKL